MFLHVLEARYLGDYRVWLRFNDGTCGEVDLSGELEGLSSAPSGTWSSSSASPSTVIL